ncbi:unnamed protein product [Arctogadus glacialis]
MLRGIGPPAQGHVGGGRGGGDPPSRMRLIVGALTVCWMPNQVRRLMGAALPKASWTRAYFQSYVTLQPVADTFFYLSSVLNPLLYNLSSRQFREVFVQVLRCRLRIEHVNKRTVRTAAPAAEASTRSRRPLLSLHRGGRTERSTGAPGKTRDGPLRFLIFKTNSGSAHASAGHGQRCPLVG